MTDVRELRLVVTTEDYDAAVAFYRDALGLAEAAEYVADGQGRVIILEAGRATLEISDVAHAVHIDEVEVGRRVAGHVRVAFGVADAAATTGELTVCGCPSHRLAHAHAVAFAELAAGRPGRSAADAVRGARRRVITDENRSRTRRFTRFAAGYPEEDRFHALLTTGTTLSDISVLRRVLTTTGLFAGVALAAAGCSSSGGTSSNPAGAGSSAAKAVTSAAGSVASSMSSAMSSAPSAMSSAAGGSSSSSSSGGGGAAAGGGGADKSAACADIAKLVSKSSDIAKAATSSGGASAHFSELKSLYGDLASISSKIAGEAPSAISADAKKVATSINALNDAVKNASSVADVKSKVASDPSLKTASTNFEGALTNLVKYRGTSCG